MAIDPAEFDLLKRRADDLGLYLNEHRDADWFSDAVFYIMPKRKSAGQPCPSLLKYATAEQCWKFLDRYLEP